MSILEQIQAAFPKTLTEPELAAILRVDRRAAKKWAEDHHVPRMRVGRLVRYSLDPVMKVLSASLPMPEMTAEGEKNIADGLNRITKYVDVMIPPVEPCSGAAARQTPA